MTLCKTPHSRFSFCCRISVCLIIYNQRNFSITYFMQFQSDPNCPANSFPSVQSSDTRRFLIQIIHTSFLAQPFIKKYRKYKTANSNDLVFYGRLVRPPNWTKKIPQNHIPFDISKSHLLFHSQSMVVVSFSHFRHSPGPWAID